MSIPLSYSEKLEYQIEYSIFTRIDNVSQQTKWLRPIAFLAFGISNLTCFTARTLSVLELATRGLILSFALSSENRARGWSLLKRAPKQGLNALLVIFPGLLSGSIIIITAPKFYILSRVENTQVDFDYAKTDTIGTQPYKADSQRAVGRAKEKFRKWQGEDEG